MSWYAIWSYLSAFCTTVVIGCMDPYNFKYCIQMDQWLFPAVGDIMRARKPYALERNYLESLDNGAFNRLNKITEQ
jgi:hypothetical protein